MTIPNIMDFKPVFSVKDYHKADGKKAWMEEEKELSLGLQMVEQQPEMTAKIQVDDQAVELPINRVLDLTILLAQTSLYLRDAYRFKKFYDPENPTVEIIGVQGGRMTVEVDLENPTIDQDILTFYDTANKNGELLGERYGILKRLLEELGY